MEGGFGELAACVAHETQLASFAASFFSPPELFLERRPEAEPVLRAILRATEDCPLCRRKADRAGMRRIVLSSDAAPATPSDIVVRLTCTHKHGGPWDCAYRADVKRKILLLGDASARKTELVRPAVFDFVPDGYRDSLGAKVMTRHETVNLETQGVAFHIVFTVWGIAGSRFGTKGLLADYFRGPRAVLAVCDLSHARSVEELGYWLSVATRILGKTRVVIVAKERTAPDPLPIAEARLKEIVRNHHATLVMVPSRDSHTLEHVFRGIGEDTIRDVFGAEGHPRIYL